MRAGPGWAVWKEEAGETSPALPAGAAIFPRAQARHLCEGKEVERLETHLRLLLGTLQTPAGALSVNSRGRGSPAYCVPSSPAGRIVGERVSML